MGKILLTVCAGVLSASLAFAQSPKMSPKISKDLEGIGSSSQVDVIVQFNQAPTARHHQKVLDRGGKLKQQHEIIKGGAYSVPASALADLAADPDVAYISPDRPVTGTASGADTNSVLDYYLPTLNAQYASSLDMTAPVSAWR